MTTFQYLSGTTLAYNARGYWLRNHDMHYWAVTSEESVNAAVIDDFGCLVIVPWRLYK